MWSTMRLGSLKKALVFIFNVVDSDLLGDNRYSQGHKKSNVRLDERVE